MSDDERLEIIKRVEALECSAANLRDSYPAIANEAIRIAREVRAFISVPESSTAP